MKITKTQLKQIIKEELEEAMSGKEKRRAIEKKARELAAADGKDWAQIKDAEVYKRYRARASQPGTLGVDPGDSLRQDAQVDKEVAKDFLQRMKQVRGAAYGKSGFGKALTVQKLQDPQLLQDLDDFDNALTGILQRLEELIVD
tara:strand:- start:1303 stop:1734 length:432 start_codon:yes stop_codon:yes gene_type:complete